jgi:hypothetical protein
MGNRQQRDWRRQKRRRSKEEKLGCHEETQFQWREEGYISPSYHFIVIAITKEIV